MFKNVRVGSHIYILHRNEPRLEIAEVRSVETLPPEFNMAYQNGVPYQQQHNFVTIHTRVGDNDVNLTKLPSEIDVCDCNGMIVSESKDAMLSEVYALQNTSKAILDSMEKHQGVIDKCNEFLSVLNPDIKKEEDRAKEMDALKEDVNEIKAMLTSILGKQTKKE